jgi:ParB-like nuclease domain
VTSTSIQNGRQRIALERIAIPDNVRELDVEHVDSLAASIKLRGLLVPVIVRPLGEDYELYLQPEVMRSRRCRADVVPVGCGVRGWRRFG